MESQKKERRHLKVDLCSVVFVPVMWTILHQEQAPMLGQVGE